MTEKEERVLATPALCQHFWQEFCLQEERLARLPIRDFVDEANELLERFIQGLALEVQGVKNDPMHDAPEPADPSSDVPRRELVISAHGVIERFPDVMLMAQLAPSLNHYRVITFRWRNDEPSFGMRMSDFELATDDVQVGYYKYHGLIGLELKFNKSIPMDMTDHSRNMACIMLDHVLGEFDSAVRVGALDFVQEFSSDVLANVPMPEFPHAYDTFWKDTLGRTGELDFLSDSGGWTMLSYGSKDEPEKIVSRQCLGS
jgi:hypothetical protein